MRTLPPLAMALTMLMTMPPLWAKPVLVHPGGNPVVTLDITGPGSDDTVSVSAASTYVFSQAPYLANNPSGLWWDAGGNTFKVAFVDDQVTSADMTVAGKLKKAGGGGGGGRGPEEWDFTQPGVATLSGSVGAVFEKPDEYWVMASPDPDTVDCQVRFYSANGTVGEPSGRNYTWSGDNLGSFGSATFADQCDSFTYTVSQDAAGKQGQIKGEFTGLTVGGSGSFSAKATSIMQKAFKIEFNGINITENVAPTFQNGALTCKEVVFAYLKATPANSQIPFEARLIQTCSSYGENQFTNAGPGSVKMIYYTSSGSFYYDPSTLDTAGWDASKSSFFSGDEDQPKHPVMASQHAYNSSYRRDELVDLVQGRKISGSSWRTYGRNTWAWYATHTNGAASVVASGFTTGSASGSASSDPTPELTPTIHDVTTDTTVYY